MQVAAQAVSAALWDSYRARLTEALGIGEASLFKLDSGLAAADWEGLDLTGLPPPPANLGKLASARVYAWADAMPRWDPANYEPGNSFHDCYCTFLANLKSSPAVVAAQQRAATDTMSDAGPGSASTASYPAYDIAPDLGGWYQGALQTLTGNQPPVLDFTVSAGAAPAVAGKIAAAARWAKAPGAAPPSPAPGSGSVDMPFLAILDLPPTGMMLAARPRRNAAVAPPVAPGLTLHYTAQALGSFSVAAGRWYDGSMLAVYADQIDPASPLAGKPLFGANGLFGLRTARIVVALGRSVSITGAPKQIAQIAAAHGATTGATAIGGFAFEARSARTETSATGGSFVLKDNTNTPYVIGLQVAVLGPG